MLHGDDNAFGQVTTVGVVTDLRAVTENVQWVLVLDDLLNEIRHDMAHGQLHIARQHLDLAEGTTLADTNAVERSHDRVGQSVLFPRCSGVVLDRKLLESVGGERRRNFALVTFLARPMLGRLEDHRRAHVGHLLQPAFTVGPDGCVARRRHDPFVRGQQVIGVGMKVGDPADHRRRRDEMVAVGGQLGHEIDITTIAFNKGVALVVVIALGRRAIFGIVVDADNLVAGIEELGDDITGDETGRAGQQDFAHDDPSLLAGSDFLGGPNVRPNA